MSVNDLAIVVQALLIYPGAAFLLAAGLILAWILDRRNLLIGLRALRRPQTRTARLALFSLVAMVLAMLALPWPGYRVVPRFGAVWGWFVFEMAVFLPLMPALFDGAPRMVRAAARTAQYGIFGRLLFWTLLTIGLIYPVSFEPLPLIGRLLLLAGMFICFPAAAGRLSGVAEPWLGVDALAYGSDGSADEAALIALTTAVRDAALLLMALFVGLPLAALPDWIVVLVLVAAMAGIGGLIRWQQGQVPRATLTAGLRRILFWATLLAGGALVLMR